MLVMPLDSGVQRGREWIGGRGHLRDLFMQVGIQKIEEDCIESTMGVAVAGFGHKVS